MAAAENCGRGKFAVAVVVILELLGRVMAGPSSCILFRKMPKELVEKQCLVAPLSPLSTAVLLGTTGLLRDKLFNFMLFGLFLQVVCPNHQLLGQLWLLPFMRFCKVALVW